MDFVIEVIRWHEKFCVCVCVCVLNSLKHIFHLFLDFIQKQKKTPWTDVRR